jgi:hypothetical protein
MIKPLGGVCPITVGETLYQLASYILCLQFCEAFATIFSPHQFGVASKGGCEIIIQNITCTLGLHHNWVVFQLDVANAFTSMSRHVIFQELLATGGDILQFIPFVVHFMHLSFLCFIIIVIMKVMSHSSHLPWGFVKVIL